MVIAKIRRTSKSKKTQKLKYIYQTNLRGRNTRNITVVTYGPVINNTIRLYCIYYNSLTVFFFFLFLH